MSPGAARSGGAAARGSMGARHETRRDCAICVLLCTTRESARLWEKTGLFNLRLSSDAPNLQVENEETIEALSARTKALLDSIQQRFLFARSICAFVRLIVFVGFAPAVPPLRFARLPFVRETAAQQPGSPFRIVPFSLSFGRSSRAFAAREGMIGYDPSGRVRGRHDSARQPLE
ncbi:hypothetical protein [Trinickia sp.]|uniref:hypothetical protein n=1 Tax=Trinickia sp. TaxID=2571163 RepID=UPI003F81470B